MLSFHESTIDVDRKYIAVFEEMKRKPQVGASEFATRRVLLIVYG